MGAPADLAPDEARARLLARIRREFDIAEDTLDIAGYALRFIRVADPNAVLDEVCRLETLREQGVAPRRELHVPYWAAVWESGVAVSEHLARRAETAPLAGVRTLDLGCGMGMAGAAMAMFGAQVTLGDIDTAALLFARLNTLPWAERCHVARCDWRGEDLPGPFDLIVGADVLYEVSQWPYIEAFARRRLAAGGALILGEPGRPTAKGFQAWLEALGWTVSADRARAGEMDVNIYEARPRA
ncbi:class I SAM-dependent methyltransferase [Phenylobacterium sp.]|jgi:predicted nicotinamide N-methyase|uniref:class I SAM-dependent methyltransferase n=1 Tax=Phenylobacterium sp. TaxID=1871053 RepID=UPI002E2FB502|nr:methyltransferase [Phenylobacterium sp.]HEX2558725.1 methyltransferase [Phenylobacterium sp.]